MESQDKKKEYEDNVWEIYRKEWETASPEKKIELNKRMRSWQELMKSGLTAQQAYIRVMEGESEKSPIYTLIEEKLDIKVAEEPSDKLPRYSLWEKTPKALSVILGLALVVAIVYCVVITGDRNALNTELESVQSVLTSTQSELSSTKQSLALTQADLSSTKQTLASTQSDLTNTKQTLASTQSDLTNTKQTLTSTKQTLASTQSELGSTKQNLTLTQGDLEKAEAKIILFQETFGADVFSGQQPQVTGGGSVGSPNIKNNPTATNVSWGQLERFLLFDPTDDKTYSLYTFNCVSFAEMLHNNAEDAGIKAAFVSLTFKDEPIGHALNAFITTNRGLVYVDCTGGTSLDRLKEQLYGLSMERDRIAYVEKNRKYGVLPIHTSISPEYSYYEEYYEVAKEVLGYWWVPGDIVESIEIYW